MKLAKQSNFVKASVKDEESLLNYVEDLEKDIELLYLMTHGRVRFGTGVTTERGENVSGEFLDITTNASADTETSFAHTLGSTPIGYIVIGRDKGAVIYDGSTSWTSTAIYLRSNIVSVAAKLFLLK